MKEEMQYDHKKNKRKRVFIYVIAIFFLLIPYFTGAWKPSCEKTNIHNCMTTRAFSLLGILSFSYNTYDDSCAEAQAVVSIMKSSMLRNPADPVFTALAIETWRNKYPRVSELVDALLDAMPEPVSDSE